MWVVTATHEQSGRTVEVWGQLLGYTFMRGGGGPPDKLPPVMDMRPTVSQRLAVMIIQALVHRPGASLLQPSVKNFAQFLPDGDVDLLESFYAQLSKLSDEIALWNKTAIDPMVMLDPRELEVAVTV